MGKSLKIVLFLGLFAAIFDVTKSDGNESADNYKQYIIKKQDLAVGQVEQIKTEFKVLPESNIKTKQVKNNYDLG